MSPATGKKVLAILGYGPGISTAVAKLFAGHGFALALVSRNQAKVDQAAAAYKAAGIAAAGFSADLAKPSDVKAVLAKIAAELGPVTVLWYNPPPSSFGDILTIDLARVEADQALMITGLIAAVQAAVPQLDGQDGAAILVTGAGFALAAENPYVAGIVPGYGGNSVASIKAAQRNLVHTLAVQLEPKGIKVGEVLVYEPVKGTELVANLPGAVLGVTSARDVADNFWKLYSDPASPVTIHRVK